LNNLFVAVHESGVGTTRKRLAARIDSANWGIVLQNSRCVDVGTVIPFR
jgi:hypothetical protein